LHYLSLFYRNVDFAVAGEEDFRRARGRVKPPAISGRVDIPQEAFLAALRVDE
jgi:hypothetical protein